MYVRVLDILLAKEGQWWDAKWLEHHIGFLLPLKMPEGINLPKTEVCLVYLVVSVHGWLALSFSDIASQQNIML